MTIIATKTIKAEKPVKGFTAEQLMGYWGFATGLKIEARATPEELQIRRQLKNGKFTVRGEQRRGHWLLIAEAI